MGLPIKAIDRIFARLAATYMAAWDRSLGAVPLSDIKTAWSYELGGFENRLQDIAWALDNLPEKPPNVIEFKKLCRLAPVTETPQLEAPKADPERLKAELAKLGHIAQRLPRWHWATTGSNHGNDPRSGKPPPRPSKSRRVCNRVANPVCSLGYWRSFWRNA
jgi:hypothetical protein